MVGDRKHVTICSSNDSFNGALRLMLDDHEVHVISTAPDTDTGTDVLVWRIDDELEVDKLRGIASSIPTLVLAREDQLIQAVDAGCRGFLTESASLHEVRSAVDTMLDGRAVVPPDLLGSLLHHLVLRRRREQFDHEALPELTDREREVFGLAVDGLRKDEIGERLFMSPATARTHLQRIYRKLGVHSQSELIALSMRIGGTHTEETE